MEGQDGAIKSLVTGGSTLPPTARNGEQVKQRNSVPTTHVESIRGLLSELVHQSLAHAQTLAFIVIFHVLLLPPAPTPGPREHGFLSERSGMAEYEDQLPESQLVHAQWLADELALYGHEDISAIDLLDALASVGLKLVPDLEGSSSHEYMSAHKSMLRSPNADLN